MRNCLSLKRTSLSRSRDYLILSDGAHVFSTPTPPRPTPQPSSRPDSSCAHCTAGNVWKSRSREKLLRNTTREQAAGLLFTVCDHASDGNLNMSCSQLYQAKSTMSLISWTVFDTLFDLSQPAYTCFSHSEHPGEGLTRTSADYVSHVI